VSVTTGGNKLIKLLSKWFIKGSENIENPVVRAAYGTLCGVVGICFNLILFTIKLIAGQLSRSIAITADAFNNLSDAGSSIVTLLGFKIAEQKPDPDHPFGHGRYEYISGLVVSLIILVMGFELLKTSIEKIITQQAPEGSPLVFIILGISILIKCYMAFYNHKYSKKINSTAMKATAFDSLSDSVSTFAVLISLLVYTLFKVNIDAYAGLLVSLFILVTGYKSAKETISPLLGQPPSEELVKKIEHIVMSYEGILGIHDLIVHDYGPGRLVISLHAEVSASGNILELHDVIDNAERQLKEELSCIAVIHMDPIVTDDESAVEAKSKVLDLLHEIDPVISMHDFRMVTGPTHTNLIFDIIVPFKYRMSDSELNAAICKSVSQIPGNYFAVVQIDKSYVM